MQAELNRTLESWLAKNNIRKSAAQKLMLYLELLKAEKSIRNIIGTADDKLLITDHIIPSLELSRVIIEKSGLDMGSGNGFPGIIIAILCPDKNIVLMEPRASRINFLNKVKKELNLNNVINIKQRGEIAGKNEYYRENFEFGTCRAVADLKISAELVLPLLKKGGRFYAPRGKTIQSEINNSEEMILKLGGGIEKILEHNIVVIRKKNDTPSKYPRKWNKIIKDKK